jgi:hypothetical protein
MTIFIVECHCSTRKKVFSYFQTNLCSFGRHPWHGNRPAGYPVTTPLCIVRWMQKSVLCNSKDFSGAWEGIVNGDLDCRYKSDATKLFTLFRVRIYIFLLSAKYSLHQKALTIKAVDLKQHSVSLNYLISICRCNIYLAIIWLWCLQSYKLCVLHVTCKVVWHEDRKHSTTVCTYNTSPPITELTFLIPVLCNPTSAAHYCCCWLIHRHSYCLYVHICEGCSTSLMHTAIMVLLYFVLFRTA